MGGTAPWLSVDEDIMAESWWPTPSCPLDFCATTCFTSAAVAGLTTRVPVPPELWELCLLDMTGRLFDAAVLATIRLPVGGAALSGLAGEIGGGRTSVPPATVTAEGTFFRFGDGFGGGGISVTRGEGFGGGGMSTAVGVCASSTTATALFFLATGSPGGEDGSCCGATGSVKGVMISS